MAFSIRKIISNITYFKKTEETSENPDNFMKKRCYTYVVDDPIDFEKLEPDSTSRYSSLQLPDSVKKYAAKKGSLSDTDILNLSDAPIRHKRRKCKKLKIDIKKASQSMQQLSDVNIENTPKHVLLECKSSEAFSERIKGFDFNKSFDMYDEVSDIESSFEEEELEIDSLSEHSESSSKSPVRMCRKIDNQSTSDENIPVPSTTPESFADVELDKNEEERVRLLFNYQMRFERLETFLKKLLTEFQFHIEVSKIFHSRSIVSALPGSDFNNIPKKLGDVYVDDMNRDTKNSSPNGIWNVIMEKEDHQTKTKIRKQFLSMKNSIDHFMHNYLHNESTNKKYLLSKKKESQKRFHISHKKKQKHFDFPDLRDAMIHLFSVQDDSISNCSFDESYKCICKCHQSSPTQTDSGLTANPDHSMSITSSIGNFTLDSTTLTAYSESLDQIISYNSFQDSLYNTFLQKATIERITFYIQVHSIQLKCEQNDADFESKQSITFHCPSCKNTETEENGLLKHILSQSHCEKIHFLYKTAYIKKCVAAGKEIQPSTVLNPMTLYRDENKIVCFGDALYACSLCFENLIVGESVLMAHCADPYHVERKEKLCEME
ncbi:unnamed protein product [Colias eurytheme]|nr:unnamed protein product [Colias eurytheme]